MVKISVFQFWSNLMSCEFCGANLKSVPFFTTVNCSFSHESVEQRNLALCYLDIWHNDYYGTLAKETSTSIHQTIYDVIVWFWWNAILYIMKFSVPSLTQCWLKRRLNSNLRFQFRGQMPSSRCHRLQRSLKLSHQNSFPLWNKPQCFSAFEIVYHIQ